MRGWEVKQLGGALKLEYGKPLPEEDRDDDGAYPAYGANGVKCQTKKFFFGKPSIIVGRKGSAGEITLTEEKFWPLDVTYFVTFDERRYDLMFLYHCLKSLQLTRLAKGVKPGLNRNEVYRIEFAFPPLSEQKRIVAILDEILAGIDAATANVEKNLANSRELFDVYLRSALGQRGLGWEEKTLKEVSAEFGRGKSKHRPRGDVKLLGGQYPLIQTGDVANSNHHIVEYSQTYNEFGLAQSKLWPKGTVCIAIVGANVAETAILDFDACFPDSVIGLVVDNRLANNEYVEFLLQTFKALLKQRGKGTARDNINLATFEGQRFPFPDVAKQRQIVARINGLAEQTRRLESLYQQKLDYLAELKQAILQKALAGELTAQPEKPLREAAAA
jgi:type I restriction enzyme, S subunit